MSEFKPIFVDWCAKDALDGMTMLTAMEELAYRRVLDLIYATNDRVPDDDRRLAWVTKVGARWKKIKASLIAMGKLEVIDGRVTNGRCREVLADTHQRIQAAHIGAAAAAEARRRKAEEEARRKAALAAVTGDTPAGGPPDTPGDGPADMPTDPPPGQPSGQPSGTPADPPPGTSTHHPPPIKEDNDDDGARAGSLGASSSTSGRGAPDWDGETDPTALASAIRPRDPSVIDPDPAIAEAAVMGAAMFLAARNRRWPRHPTPSAPHLTLMAECAGFARRGASPDVMAAVFERGMDDESRSGAGPPTSAAFRKHQVERQVKDLRRLQSQGAGDGIDIVGVGDGPRQRSGSGGGNPYTAAAARAVAGLAGRRSGAGVGGG